MNRWLKRGSLLMSLLTVACFLGACAQNTSATSASCSFVVGDGQHWNGNSQPDSKVHRIVFPGQNFTYDDSYEVVRYVACGPRNFITNDGSVKNANGKPVGDRFNPTVAYTSTGTAVKVWTSAYWQLNQGELGTFYTFCFKYGCSSDKQDDNSANFATAGWNGMLGENFGPAIDRAAQVAAKQLDDKVWQTHDAVLYKDFGDTMSREFTKAIRVTSGYDQDLFCGSGNSGWQDPNNPGKGKFTCTNVRIAVDKVEAATPTLNLQAEQQSQLQSRLSIANQLYGPYAQQVLASQDIIASCKAAGSTCVVSVGGGSTAVAVPTGR